jgi:hypothetical protein
LNKVIEKKIEASQEQQDNDKAKQNRTGTATPISFHSSIQTLFW